MIYDRIISKTPITKGWSGDRKYCITTADGEKYLLRISPVEQYDRKKSGFEMMRRVSALGIPMCQPMEFGTCDDGVYSIQSWINGKDAEKTIPTLSDTQQYVYGFEAGRILKQIHSIPAPAAQENWEIRFNRKIERKMELYNDCPIKYENGQAFIDYINANRHLLNGRSQCYQHGDYHIGNMMIDREGKLQIIDFDRDDFGDPWEEFNRIVWCAQASPLFASGMVNAYFDGHIPMDFWRLLALYIASNTLSSIPWAIPFGRSEIDTMQKQAQEVLHWYDDMKNPVPTWYQLFEATSKAVSDNRSERQQSISEFRNEWDAAVHASFCFCGHDCSRCLTYLATVHNDDGLRLQSQAFYRDFIKCEIPLTDIKCHGGRSNDVFYLCNDCPFMKCCMEKGISACSECNNQCPMFLEYRKKHVNKHNQIGLEKK